MKLTSGQEISAAVGQTTGSLGCPFGLCVLWQRLLREWRIQLIVWSRFAEPGLKAEGGRKRGLTVGGVE